jgi:hypothetical protein
MSFDDLLDAKRSAILERWFNLILESYPAETVRFLRSQKDRFANPVGHAVSTGLEGIFDELRSGGLDRDKLSPFLDRIIRIRAIQDFSPSQALAFVFLLKNVIRTELARAEVSYDELAGFEDRIDALALLSFDIYSQCRDKLGEIRLNDYKRATNKLLERAKLRCPTPALEPDDDKR